jgi:hypothetical protein
LAPCEKAIFDKDDDSLSLISVMHGVTALVANDASLPANSAIPKPWAVAGIWLREPGDEGRTYLQRLVLVSPSGDILAEGTIPLSFPTRTFQSVIALKGFPIGEHGDYEIRISLREETPNAGEWRDVMTYPIEELHLPPAEADLVGDGAEV